MSSTSRTIAVFTALTYSLTVHISSCPTLTPPSQIPTGDSDDMVKTRWTSKCEVCCVSRYIMSPPDDDFCRRLPKIEVSVHLSDDGTARAHRRSCTPTSAAASPDHACSGYGRREKKRIQISMCQNQDLLSQIQVWDKASMSEALATAPR